MPTIKQPTTFADYAALYVQLNNRFVDSSPSTDFPSEAHSLVCSQDGALTVILKDFQGKPLARYVLRGTRWVLEKDDR